MGERVPGVGRRVTRFNTPNLLIACPSFYVLHWARGCRFDCSYCYLSRTFRRLPGGKAFKQYDGKEVLRHLGKWLRTPSLPWEDVGVYRAPALINAGELADSLAGGPGLISKVARQFTNLETNPHRRALLLLTKSGHKEHATHVMREAAEAGPELDRVILSSTLNAPQFISDLESNTPPAEARLAMLHAVRAEFPKARIRVRIDPIAGWYDDGLQWLCDRVRELEPELVTLGSFRLYPQDRGWFGPDNQGDKARAAAISRVWESLGDPGPDGRRRPRERLPWFVDVADRLVGLRVGLCKEPINLVDDFWIRTGRTWVGCNCTGTPTG